MQAIYLMYFPFVNEYNDNDNGHDVITSVFCDSTNSAKIPESDIFRGIRKVSKPFSTFF